MAQISTQVLLILFSIIGFVFSIRVYRHLQHTKSAAEKKELQLFHYALPKYGIAYYLAVFCYALSLFFVHSSWYELVIAMIITSLALLIALAFTLKKSFFHGRFDVESWVFCVTNAVILFLVVIDFDVAYIVEALTQGREFMVMVHLFAMVLGLGGATYSDILLIRFLKDFKISAKESDVIRTLSDAIWVGVGLAIISGIGLFIINAHELLMSSKFIAKCIIFTILVINGALLHLYLLPHLMKISFHETDKKGRRHILLRTAGFIAGPISLVSWYTVFVLGSFRKVPLSLPIILALYGGVLLIAIVCSLVVEAKYRHEAMK